jgi:hypothetical protein
VKGVGSGVGVILATAAVFGCGPSIQVTTQDADALRTSESVDIHERAGVDVFRSAAQGGVARNPDESSFGTLQPDGTYCGAFCSENH